MWVVVFWVIREHRGPEIGLLPDIVAICSIRDIAIQMVEDNTCCEHPACVAADPRGSCSISSKMETFYVPSKIATGGDRGITKYIVEKWMRQNRTQKYWMGLPYDVETNVFYEEGLENQIQFETGA